MLSANLLSDCHGNVTKHGESESEIFKCTNCASGGGGESGGGSNGPEFSCSYAMVVFSFEGKTFVMKIGNNTNSCTGAINTSSDATFSYECNGRTYDNNGAIFHDNGAVSIPYSGPPDCNALFQITANSITAAPGVKIIFGVAHNGSFPNHFAELCPAAGGVSAITFPSVCSSGN